MRIKSFEIMPKEKLTNETRHKIENCIYPPVTNWLRGFMDAKFVITDSFHGCVFSIIFNVPFLVIGNEKRGMARFDSLLQTFGLEDRLLINISDFNLDKINNSINWASVNNKLNIELKKSFTFLEKSLLPN